MKKLLIIFFLVPVFVTSQAQDTQEKVTKGATPSPDFPGSLVFEFGLNYFLGNSHEMRNNPWKSFTYNAYYIYPIQINKSAFAFVPGIGVGSEKYGFEDPVTLYDSLRFTLLENVRDLPQFNNFTEVKLSQVVANYVDIPLELRWHSRKDDFKRSLFVSVGGKIGVNFDAKTKIKYGENGYNKTFKDKHHYNINSFRYGLTGRIGYGPVSVWYYYSASQFFRGNTTPNAENPNMWSFGLSFATF